MEPATFRPPPRRVGRALALGAAAGAVLGVALQVPPLLALLFGAAAAGIAVAARHARGLRVVADEHGLRVLGAAEPLQARWEELRVGFGLAAREDGAVQRYAAFADPAGRSFAFGDLGARACAPVTGADGRRIEVVDLRDAPLLLALLVQRGGAWQALPDSLRGPATQAAPDAVDAPTPGAGVPAASTAPVRARRQGLGLWAVAAKLGSKMAGALGKAGAGALKAAKTANLGWAAASAATYSVLFSWKFALAIMVQLFVHEYGHVHAMRRTGMKVRGMYFVPFLGALAVTEDEFTSRRQQAYVALNGPLWGSALALVPAGLWAATGEPTWAAVAAWWALINLFNLLPIAPLDGGRVMQAFALSYSSGLGLAMSALGLVAAVALASAFGFSLIWLVAALGAMELASEAQARAGTRALRLLPEPARFGPPQWLHLRAVVGPGPGDDVAFLRALGRQQRAARAEPLRPRQLLAWGLAYAGLAAALVVLVWTMRHVPGADVATRVLE